ncbi:threonine synthase [Desulfonatronum thiosulfatophilum]|uniref:Threonine synthase n=1 Tax=Desulfonatronum thiosulfatophilum TaxID=617002 RepID=A0A1G6ALL3_9BACT|nr:threonine synthase [Desulfonatronum thiosulfatophilum]SDB09282.1 threonine synthase [Desulfonatronum thiosulfatophilum]
MHDAQHIPFPQGPYVTGAVCQVCGRSIAPGEISLSSLTCPCSGDNGILDIRYDYEAARPLFTPASLAAGPRTMWRYRALLPLPDAADVPPLATGFTPLYESPRLAKLLGVARVLVKDDTRQPTASLKDRASALATSQAKVMGLTTLACASTGNAAAALAGMAASMELTCVIFVPASAPQAKVAQLLAFGARVFTVDGSYDDAFELCMAACRVRPWYNRNTATNPFMTEGKKTVAFEIAEQSEWSIPDRVFVGVGDGCIIGGLHKGFADLTSLGMTARLPRLMGVQAAGSDFLYQAWRNNENVLTKPAIQARTVADSISAGLPRDRIKALRAVRETGGAYLRVEDDSILQAIPLLARSTGVFAEPAGAAALAGALTAAQVGALSPDETICLLITGSGLKDVASAIQACTGENLAPVPIPPGSRGLERVLDTLPSE